MSYYIFIRSKNSVIVKTYITCPACGTVNVNVDYCISCGQIINVIKRRTLERKQRENERMYLRQASSINKQPSWISRWRKDKNPLKKITGGIIYVVYIITISVAAFLAYIAGIISA